MVFQVLYVVLMGMAVAAALSMYVAKCKAEEIADLDVNYWVREFDKQCKLVRQNEADYVRADAKRMELESQVDKLKADIASLRSEARKLQKIHDILLGTAENGS